MLRPRLRLRLGLRLTPALAPGPRVRLHGGGGAGEAAGTGDSAAPGACGRCGKTTSTGVACEDTGTVVSFSIGRGPSQNIQVDLPYVAANIVLDGADISFSALMQECPYEEVRIGMRVQAVWKPKAEWGTTMANIRYFRPLDEPDVAFEKIKEIS